MKRLEREFLPNLKYLGFLAFLGLGGFNYYSNYEIGNLLLFSFFGFVGFFFLGNLLVEKHDERFIANAAKAGCIALGVAVIALLAVGISSIYVFSTKELTVIVCATGIAASLLAYSIAFYYFEKH